jgi:anti-sigma regulatory factor (Ser/Thr protein kinase)
MGTRSLDMTWRIGRQDDASRVARNLVSEVLVPVVAPATVSDAVLMTSELVTNVMMHTPDGCTLGLTYDPALGIVRVEVSDSSPQLLATVRSTPPSDRVGGFGLKLVTRLADKWGHEVDPHRKTVWFELDSAKV